MRYETPENEYVRAIDSAYTKKDRAIINALKMAFYEAGKYRTLHQLHNPNDFTGLDHLGCSSEIEEALRSGIKIDSIIRALEHYRDWNAVQEITWTYL